MLRILPNVASLREHVHRLIYRATEYRPEHCPICCGAHLRRHGCYKRKPRGECIDACTAVKVPRFLCIDCKHTCSVLPSCIAPRRWYMWSVQQPVLTYLLCGGTQEKCAEELEHLGPAISTMRRWWRWLQSRHEGLAFHLRSKQPQWGRAADWQEFWQRAFRDEPLRELMAYLDAQGLTVP
jgi:Domain of unknown function (DUF6431)